jgi:endoglycosylceramidase
MWAGLYPEKNKINQTYADEMSEIIRTLESYGIYVILDMHQDMMSSKFNQYDGVPIWVVNELPDPKHPYPWPFSNKSTNIGFAGYVTDACGFAFQCLYNNVSGSESYFHQFWAKVAQIHSNFSSVLGVILSNLNVLLKEMKEIFSFKI